ncbi:hypothetical protein D5086_005884 [Populus alba]|uniref:Uncharacterized protein n=1 Tax=Populus alba TaxID=43335 RepID=A0ACC4CUM4_POPAL
MFPMEASNRDEWRRVSGGQSTGRTESTDQRVPSIDPPLESRLMFIHEIRPLSIARKFFRDAEAVPNGQYVQSDETAVERTCALQAPQQYGYGSKGSYIAPTVGSRIKCFFHEFPGGCLEWRASIKWKLHASLGQLTCRTGSTDPKVPIYKMQRTFGSALKFCFTEFRRLFPMRCVGIRDARGRQTSWRATPPARREIHDKKGPYYDPTFDQRSNFFTSFDRLFFHMEELRIEMKWRRLLAGQIHRQDESTGFKKSSSIDTEHSTVGICNAQHVFHEFFRSSLSHELRGIGDEHRETILAGPRIHQPNMRYGSKFPTLIDADRSSHFIFVSRFRRRLPWSRRLSIRLTTGDDVWRLRSTSIREYADPKVFPTAALGSGRQATNATERSSPPTIMRLPPIKRSPIYIYDVLRSHSNFSRDFRRLFSLEVSSHQQMNGDDYLALSHSIWSTDQKDERQLEMTQATERLVGPVHRQDESTGSKGPYLEI